ncbi:unnamed protein product [Bursaphelenchus xylophilus]|uniref:(pine wood nematode) hypothetical protein n=1 Tax=Bursaphelenchus xylophilus TaxID=6326 RepID=A0A1I7S3U0_BURXY|nr:unnamed protein product [Bursaphelenchus xylophilus]CAG9116512.1 unnamed protein product [Bursaphelenchus xylophilus]
MYNNLDNLMPGGNRKQMAPFDAKCFVFVRLSHGFRISHDLDRRAQRASDPDVRLVSPVPLDQLGDLHDQRILL